MGRIPLRRAAVQMCDGSSGGEREVRIAVIDASQVALRSYTALECIRPSRQNGPRNEWISKCENFARAMQFVSVKGDIPDYAVVSVQYWQMIEVDLPCLCESPKYPHCHVPHGRHPSRTQLEPLWSSLIFVPPLLLLPILR